MNILVISGSRNPAGQTARAAEAFLQGAAESGADVGHILLPPLKIERCRQCEDNGWGLCRREGRCIIADDFAGIVDRMRKADALAFSTPVYFSDLSESLRAFLDRLRRIGTQENGKKGLAGKSATGICVAGGGGGGAPACCLALEKILASCGFDVTEVTPVRRQSLALKIEQLKLSGRTLASGK
jgi:multimeric flavodoxin WrbA